MNDSTPRDIALTVLESRTNSPTRPIEDLGMALIRASGGSLTGHIAVTIHLKSGVPQVVDVDVKSTAKFAP